MALRLGDIDADARYDAWSQVVERIKREQVNQAWSHYMFRLLRAVFTTNPSLSEKGGFIFEWMVDNYVDAALMLIRRELDVQSGTENLKNLLLDLIEHPMVVTRARYLSRWEKENPAKEDPANRWLADRTFDRFNPIRVEGNSDADYIDPDMVRADLDQLDASADHLRKYAERTRAHRTPELSLDTAEMTFKALHDAIADVQVVVKKYYRLLTLGSLVRWEPVPQYDTLEAFTKPWIVDRAAVKKASKDSAL